MERYRNICWGLDYTHLAGRIKGIIHKHWHMMENILRCQMKPFVGFRRTKNLKDYLMYHKVDREGRETGHLPEGLAACGHCNICRQAIQSNTIKHNGISLINKKIVTCSTRNVIYYLKCFCGLAYIGYTKRMICTRICEHKSCIQN